MPFDANAFRNDPVTYLGGNQFIAPGATANEKSADVTGSIILPNIAMRLLTMSNQTSLRDFSVTATTPHVATIAAGTFRGYWLPWHSGYAFRISLGSSADYFMTAKMNGCGIIIGGSRTNPLVIHANEDNVSVPAFRPSENIAVEGRRIRNIQSNEYKLAYGTLAAQAIAAGWFGTGTPNVSVIDPEFYLSDTLQTMSVFGVRRNAEWTFYANLHSITKKGFTLEIWPNQPTRLPTA